MDPLSFDQLVDAVDAERRAAEGNRSGLRRAAVVLTVAAVGLLLAAFGRGVLIEPVIVPTASMEPTIAPGTHVMVLSDTLYRGALAPGDIVVFGDPADSGRQLVKRVVATAGQTIESPGGAVLVDGATLDEPWLQGQATPRFEAETVPAGHVFVLGDNRDGSVDSRSFGAIAQTDVIGRAAASYWPIGAAEVLGGH